jgi:hypothetical protein
MREKLAAPLGALRGNAALFRTKVPFASTYPRTPRHWITIPAESVDETLALNGISIQLHDREEENKRAVSLESEAHAGGHRHCLWLFVSGHQAGTISHDGDPSTSTAIVVPADSLQGRDPEVMLQISSRSRDKLTFRFPFPEAWRDQDVTFIVNAPKSRQSPKSGGELS